MEIPVGSMLVTVLRSSHPCKSHTVRPIREATDRLLGAWKWDPDTDPLTSDREIQKAGRWDAKRTTWSLGVKVEIGRQVGAAGRVRPVEVKPKEFRMKSKERDGRIVAQKWTFEQGLGVGAEQPLEPTDGGAEPIQDGALAGVGDLDAQERLCGIGVTGPVDRGAEGHAAEAAAGPEVGVDQTAMAAEFKSGLMMVCVAGVRPQAEELVAASGNDEAGAAEAVELVY